MINLYRLACYCYCVCFVFVVFCWQHSNQSLLPSLFIVCKSSIVLWPTKDKELIDIEYLACWYYLFFALFYLASSCCLVYLAYLACGYSLPCWFDTSVFFINSSSIELYKPNSRSFKKCLDFKMSSLAGLGIMSTL